MNQIKTYFSRRAVAAVLEWAMVTMAAGIMFAQAPAPAPAVPPVPPVPPAPLHTGLLMAPRSGSFLGIGVKEIDADRARELKLREEHGVEVTNVDEDSPASKAGIKVGDVVTEYNGQRVEGTEQFVRFVRETPAGRQVKLGIMRGGASQTLIATIGKRKPHMSSQEWEKFRKDMEQMGERIRKDIRVEIPDVPRVAMAWRTGMLGVEVEGIEGQLAEFFGVKQGVLVRSVAKDTPAAKAGIKAGDVITKIDSEAVDSHRELTSSLRSARQKGTFPVTVVREKREMVLNVTMEPETAPVPRRGVPGSRSVGNPQQFEFDEL